MEQYLNVVKLGSNICVRGVDEYGNRYTEKVPYEPYSYVESNTITEDRSMTGRYLRTVHHESMSEAYQFKKRCTSQDIKVYGMDDNVCQYMTDMYNNDYDTENVKVFYIDIENLMRDKNGDRFGIDTEGAHGELTAITIYDTSTKKYHVFGTHEWENELYPHLDIEYYHAIDEYDLCLLFLAFWKSNYPDIVTGWNSNFYDIPYLINRLYQVIGEARTRKLSPWNKITRREHHNDKGKLEIDYKIVGIACVDYIQIYKKNTFHKQESYKLDFIANAELGKGKLDFHDEGYKNLDDLHDRNYQKYIDYNIRDVESLIQIDDKNGFVDIVIGIAHYAIVNYDEVYSVLRCWDSIRHTYLKARNVISSPKSRNEKPDQFIGAYVKEPRPAMYKWIVTFDLSSLYPSIIMTCNIGDETLLAYDDIPDELLELYDRDISRLILNEEITDTQMRVLKDNNLVMAANGTFYHNQDQSVQSILCEDILAKRKVYKTAMLKYKDEYERAKTAGADDAELKRINDLVTYNKNQQLVVKVLANSLYGAMGNQHDRYFDLKLAEGVTLTGQTIIKWAEKKVNEYLNKVLDTDDVEYCIYSDTDSIFVNLDPMVQKLGLEGEPKIVEFLDTVGDKINDKLSEFYDELGVTLNTQNNKMNMKREVISSSSIFRSKKNYAMKVWDNEGVRYDEPDYKIMGIEVVRSTTPQFIKERIREVLIMMLSDCSRTDLLDYVEKVRQEYNDNENLEDTVFPKGTKDLEKWMDAKTVYLPRVPIHVRGSLLFNKYYADEDNIIQSGDSVRYSYLKKPNPMNENVISFIDDMPEELKPYIDKGINFEKIFLKPVTSLASVIGWSMNNTISLADLMGN